MIACSRCSQPFPKKRKDLYGYDFCVNCSDVKPVVGRVVVIGEGDHTVTELAVMDQETAQRLSRLIDHPKGKKQVDPFEMLDLNEEPSTTKITVLDVERHFDDLDTDVEPLPLLDEDQEELEEDTDTDDLSD